MLKFFFTLKQKIKSKNEPIKKFEGFLLILILVAFYFIGEQYDYVKSIDEFTNHSFAQIESLKRENQVLYKAIKQQDLICNALIEDAEELAQIADSYDCLARLEVNKEDEMSILQAIRNESYALEAFYKDVYVDNLVNIIQTGYQKENFAEKNEEYILKQLVNSQNLQIRTRTLYRMSLINSLGRASSLGEYNYNLKEAVKLRNEVTKNLGKLNKKTVNLLFSLNNSAKYIQYAKTAISSILLNSDLDTYYNFYILMDCEEPISENNQKELQSLSYITPYKIEFKFIPEGMFKGKKGFAEIKTRLLFGRFLVEDVFPELDSIISLDVDIIVLRDLHKLANQKDLDDFIIAGVSEGYKVQDKKLCKFPYTYINAGVMVQNLKLMRVIGNSKLVLDKYQNMLDLDDSRCLYSLDQDVINLVYEDKIKFISKRWDYIPALNYATKFMPFIIHYAGIKPWVYRNLPYEYLKLLNEEYYKLANVENDQ